MGPISTSKTIIHQLNAQWLRKKIMPLWALELASRTRTHSIKTTRSYLSKRIMMINRLKTRNSKTNRSRSSRPTCFLWWRRWRVYSIRSVLASKRTSAAPNSKPSQRQSAIKLMSTWFWTMSLGSEASHRPRAVSLPIESPLAQMSNRTLTSQTTTTKLSNRHMWLRDMMIAMRKAAVKSYYRFCNAWESKTFWSLSIYGTSVCPVTTLPNYTRTFWREPRIS